ncbi:LysR family transcriptional regulator [Pseudophaeobacter leonis]|uniref:LysR family transcriptional regulator n=1 Tax=Pseudophaeobacter leonis TaxID=1144477 RepID=UPI0013747314|nr:LysR family transcriptional regulator [Pseudophaeobacter leonis]
MLELTPLKYFLSAYETGTFSQAARVNDVSQPTVSAAIQKLEQHFDGLLFRRSKTGLTATSLGEKLYREAVGSVAQLSALEGRIKRAPRKSVRIFCFPDILLGAFAPTLQSVGRNAADLEFSFIASAEDCDLSCVSQNCVPKGHGFLPILTEPYGVALGLQHPLTACDSLHIRDLQAYPVIHRPYCPNADGFDLFASKHTSRPAQAVNDHQVLDLISAGLGIAFVPVSHGDAHAGIVVRPVHGQDMGHRTIGFSHRKTAFATELVTILAASARR